VSQRLSWARVVATGIGDRSAGSGTSPGNTFPEILARHVIGLVDAVGATGDSLETLNQLDNRWPNWIGKPPLFGCPYSALKISLKPPTGGPHPPQKQTPYPGILASTRGHSSAELP